jgi:pyruvate dehydrogenase E2 component (dihydrolipoamide acetyltransferase)
MKAMDNAQATSSESQVAIRMPRLSDSMEDGVVVRWLVDDGSSVTKGQEIVEIETDKATMPFESPAGGQLQIVASVGDTASVGAVIGYVDARVGSRGPRRIRISPLARRIATENGVDVSSVTGTGPLGRILKADVVRAAAPATTPRQFTSPTGPNLATTERRMPGVEVGATRESEMYVDGAERRLDPMTRSQQLVAQRMAASQATIPAFAVRVEVEMAPVHQLQARLSSLLKPAPTLNDFIVGAAARTLARHPRVNGSYADGGFELHDHVNVGVAVAVGDELLVPVIRGADKLQLPELAVATRRLVERSRSGAITPPELSGATFTISNLGMFGVTDFEPIINPPQAAILGVGASRHAGTESSRPLTLTLVADHRIVYGTHAAEFLADLRTVLEEPLQLVFQT